MLEWSSEGRKSLCLGARRLEPWTSSHPIRKSRWSTSETKNVDFNNVSPIWGLAALRVQMLPCPYYRENITVATEFSLALEIHARWHRSSQTPARSTAWARHRRHYEGGLPLALHPRRRYLKTFKITSPKFDKRPWASGSDTEGLAALRATSRIGHNFIQAL